MNLRQEALEFINNIQTLYLERRDINALLPFMAEQTSWIGTGAHEIHCDLNETLAALACEIAEYSAGFTITESNYDTMLLPGQVCVIYGKIQAKAQDSRIADIKYRISAVCVKTKDGMKLAHLHASCPNNDQESGNYYEKVEKHDAKATLHQRIAQTDRELQLRNLELESLTENIPGGVQRCHHDDDFTLISMSNSFFSLFGYSREEIEERFHNHFLEMILPADRSGVLAATEAQLKCGNTVEYEYRIRCKNGKLLWILDKGRLVESSDGLKYFYCVMLDITNLKEEREELRLSLERHQIIMDQTTDIIFEWDIREDTVSFSANWHKTFGYEPQWKSISAMLQSDNIHPEDMNDIQKIIDNCIAGVSYSETEIRIKDSLGNYMWCRIRATVQYDSNELPVKATGVILNIHEDKRQKQSLMNEARRDSLTGLFNNAAAKALIEELLLQSTPPSGVLYIIDIDNFKKVNDRFGHPCGDALLTDIAITLQRLFRSQDVIGRIGGDEFMVYLPDIPFELAEEKAKEMLAALHNISLWSGSEKVSCSIGIATAPQDAQDFFCLYQCADQALYQVKSSAKGGYAMYSIPTN